MPKPWWVIEKENIEKGSHVRKCRKIMIILKWLILLAFAVGFFWFLVEMARLGL